MIIINVNNRKIENVVKDYRQKINDIKLHRKLKELKSFKKKSIRKREQLNKAKYIHGKYKKI